MSANKITSPVPRSMAGLISIDGMKITVASEHFLDQGVQNWLGIVKHNHPDAVINKASLQEVMESEAVDDDAALAINSILVKDAMGIFEWAAKGKASDIYIDVNLETGVCVIQRKINGLIDKFRLERRSIEAESIMNTIYNVMGEGKERGSFSKNEPSYASIRNPDFLPKGIHSLRLQTYVSDQGYGATIRLLPVKSVDQQKLGLAALGYNNHLSKQINTLLMTPKGGMLIFGGVGAGKSTTLQVMLDILNQWHQGKKRIYTVEDPVEYPINCAVQMGVSASNSGISSDEQYAHAVKILLRSAPDISMVGEIRGRGTAAEFFRIASSGFKGLSTIHGNGCWAGIKRLHEELQIPMSYITDNSIFSGCITQQLLQTLCPDCKLPMDAVIKQNINGMANVVKAIKKQLDAALPVEVNQTATIFFHQSSGCESCSFSGYSGRTAIAEIVICDSRMWEEFAVNGGAESGGWAAAERYWRNVQQGKPLIYDALLKIAAGIVDPVTTMREVGFFNTAAEAVALYGDRQEVESTKGSAHRGRHV